MSGGVQPAGPVAAARAFRDERAALTDGYPSAFAAAIAFAARGLAAASLLLGKRPRAAAVAEAEPAIA